LTTPLNGDTLGAVGGLESPSFATGQNPATPPTHADVLSASNTTGWVMTTGTNVQPTIILNYIIKT